MLLAVCCLLAVSCLLVGWLPAALLNCSCWLLPMHSAVWLLRAAVDCLELSARRLGVTVIGCSMFLVSVPVGAFAVAHDVVSSIDFVPVLVIVNCPGLCSCHCLCCSFRFASACVLGLCAYR